MIEEYKRLREARLALLCVGDTVYYISSTWRIYPYHIVKVEDDRVFVEVGGLYHPYYMLDIMETYEGEVYIYPDSKASSYEQRLERMIERINAHEPIIHDS
jgi:hypothetical protein